MHHVVKTVFIVIGIATMTWILYALMFGTNDGVSVDYVGSRDRTGGENSGAVWYFARGMETPLAIQYDEYYKGRDKVEGDINPSAEGMYYEAESSYYIDELEGYNTDLRDYTY